LLIYHLPAIVDDSRYLHARVLIKELMRASAMVCASLLPFRFFFAAIISSSSSLALLRRSLAFFLLQPALRLLPCRHSAAFTLPSLSSFFFLFHFFFHPCPYARHDIAYLAVDATPA